MSDQSNASNGKLTIQDIFREIECKSRGGGYIYRGERKCHKESPYNGKVSSNLWREYGIEDGSFDVELVQQEILAAAKKHTGDLCQNFRLDVIASLKAGIDLTETDTDFEILTEIQHYGGKTNLIDFTEDYFIALFFACDGDYDEHGRVILQKIDEISGMIAYPQNPRHRVIGQKSVFVRSPKGFIEPCEGQIVIVPAYLKQEILEHLWDFHGIFTEVIYNDLQGFIKHQDMHGGAYTHFYKGFVYRERRRYENAIRHYNEAIKLRPNFAEAYGNRGLVYVMAGDSDNAIGDYTKAIELRPNFAEVYGNRGFAYAKAGDFDNAIKDCNKSIELRPDFTELYGNRGVVYAKAGDFNNAIKDYTKAIELRPDFAEAYSNRGLVYVMASDFDNAIRDYTKAIELRSDFAEVYCNRGEAFLHLEKWEEAEADLRTARDMGTDIIASFQNDYTDVADFEEKNGIQLPENIIALLTPAQT